MPDSPDTPNDHFLKVGDPTGLDMQILDKDRNQPIGEQPTMSSREIADLVGSRHDSVRRAIERLAERAVIALPPMVEKPTDGRPTLEYVFAGEKGKRDSIVVVAQLSPEFTARLVDRWQELEARPAFDPSALSRIDILTLAIESEQGRLAERAQRLQLEVVNAELAPKADAFDLIAASDGSVTFTQATKVLGIKMAVLTAWLNANRWAYRQNGSWVAYRPQIENGRLEYKEANYTDQKTGMPCCRPYCHITPKGLAKLATVFASEQKRAA